VPGRGRYRLKKGISVILLLLATACSSRLPPGPTLASEASVTAASLPAGLSASATPTAVATVPSLTSSATATPAPSPTSTRSPLNLTHPKVMVLAKNLPGPDDLVLAPDGSIYISDISTGTIQQYRPDGSLQTLVEGLSVPEGMLVLPDGSLLIAEQGKNRLVRYDLKAKTLTPFLSLPNQTGLEGVDGIALDNHLPDAPSLIIPDSPHGTVLRASLDGKTVTTIATGFARPTGAWVEADGSILVPDENGAALKRIRPDGAIEKVADFSIPDDVIEDQAGNIFVVTLGDSAIHLIPAAGGRERILVAGLSSPQGIIFDADGNLIVTDPGNHRLIKIILHP
jgi:sugar lactone lactonase YvrE